MPLCSSVASIFRRWNQRRAASSAFPADRCSTWTRISPEVRCSAERMAAKTFASSSSDKRRLTGLRHIVTVSPRPRGAAASRHAPSAREPSEPAATASAAAPSASTSTVPAATEASQASPPDRAASVEAPAPAAGYSTPALQPDQDEHHDDDQRNDEREGRRRASLLGACLIRPAGRLDDAV